MAIRASVDALVPLALAIMSSAWRISSTRRSWSGLFLCLSGSDAGFLRVLIRSKVSFIGGAFTMRSHRYGRFYRTLGRYCNRIIDSGYPLRYSDHR